MTTSNKLILPAGVRGFAVSKNKRLSPTLIESGTVPPPVIPVVEKKPPPPDPETVKKSVLAEAEPRIRQETEKRVRAEEAARYKKQLDQEMAALKQAQEKRLQEETQKRDALLLQMQQKMEQFVHDMKAEIADQVVQRSIQIAEMIVRHELPDRDMLRRLIQETLGTVSDLQGAKIRIHPDDLAFIQAPGNPGIPFTGQFEWVADAALQSGDLVIESRNGIFDASLNQRLALLQEQLRRRVGKIHGTNGTT